MTGARFVRFIIGLVISLVVVPVVLPFCGVPRSHYLPPAWVYSKATGGTTGDVTAKHSQPSNNPFMIGTRLHFVDYEFLAPPPANNAKGDTHHMQQYFGEVLTDEDTYHGVNIGDHCPVKYETTYPDINGINAPGGGEGCIGPNMPTGPWLISLGVMLAVAIGIMLILDQIMGKEDI